MATMIKEERYILRAHGDEHLLRVEELIWGSESWPERFRVQIPGPSGGESMMVYGSTNREALERAAEWLLSFASVEALASMSGSQASGVAHCDS